MAKEKGYTIIRTGNSGNNGTSAVILIGLLGVGAGLAYYFFTKKKTPTTTTTTIPPVCTAGTRRCSPTSADVLEECKADGSGWNQIHQCATGCVDGQCNENLTSTVRVTISESDATVDFVGPFDSNLGIISNPSAQASLQIPSGGSNVNINVTKAGFQNKSITCFVPQGVFKDCGAITLIPIGVGQVCTAGTRRCGILDPNIIETCKADGSGYDVSQCQFGCSNNACNSGPNTASSLIAVNVEDSINSADLAFANVTISSSSDTQSGTTGFDGNVFIPLQVLTAGEDLSISVSASSYQNKTITCSAVGGQDKNCGTVFLVSNLPEARFATPGTIQFVGDDAYIRVTNVGASGDLWVDGEAEVNCGNTNCNSNVSNNCFANTTTRRCFSGETGRILNGQTNILFMGNVGACRGTTTRIAIRAGHFEGGVKVLDVSACPGFGPL